MQNPDFKQQWQMATRAANFWLIFIPPLVIAALLIWMIMKGIAPYNDVSVLATKNFWEAIALHVTSGFCLLCLLRYLHCRDKFYLWGSGIMLVSFAREIHPPFMSYGVYIGFVWLFYVAYKKPHIFADFLRSKFFVTLLGLGFFTYAFAVSVDERLWSFVPKERVFHTKLEETLEVLGHVTVGIALLFASRPKSGSAQMGDDVPQAIDTDA